MKSLRAVARALVLALSAMLWLVLPVLAYTYRAPLTISENGTAAYTMLPVIVNVDNSWMISNGFMSSTALDTRVETLGGLVKPHLVADNKTLTAIVIPTASQTNLYFTTGSTPLSSMYLITGYGGSIAFADDPVLELGANFTIEAKGYIDTTAGATKWIIAKSNGMFINVDSTTNGTLNGVIASGVPPTGFVDSTANWTSEANAFDGNTVTAAASLVYGINVWTDYLELTRAATLISQVRVYTSAGLHNGMELDVFYGGGWNNIYSADPPEGQWVSASIGSVQSVTSVRIRLRRDTADSRLFNELEYGAPIGIAATGVTSGEHTIALTLTTTNLTMTVDGVINANSMLVGPVPDSVDIWSAFANNAMPYVEYLKITVGGNQVLWYQPASYIVGTNLPDRTGTAQNGTITWGSNPAGITATLGGLVSSSQPVPGTTTATPTRDVLEDVEASDWFGEPDVSGTLQTNPLRPLVTMLSDNTTLTELQSWRLLALAFVLGVTVGAAKLVRGHLFIAGTAGGAAIGASVALTIFPLWALVFAIGFILAGVVAERSPSL